MCDYFFSPATVTLGRTSYGVKPTLLRAVFNTSVISVQTQSFGRCTAFQTFPVDSLLKRTPDKLRRALQPPHTWKTDPDVLTRLRAYQIF